MMSLKQGEINRMSRGAKIRRYLWRVNGLDRVIDQWRSQMSEPEKYGTFDDWEFTEAQGRGFTETMDEIITLACEVDPECVPLLTHMKETIVNLRMRNYELMKQLRDTPDPPLPTPEEEATAEDEKREAYRTGGASLLIKQDKDEQDNHSQLVAGQSLAHLVASRGKRKMSVSQASLRWRPHSAIGLGDRCSSGYPLAHIAFLNGVNVTEEMDQLIETLPFA